MTERSNQAAEPTGKPFKNATTGTWEFRVNLGLDGTGKRLYTRRRGFKTKGEAQQALDRLRTDVTTSSYVAPARQTVDEYLDAWLVTIKPSLEPSTLSSYGRNLKLHVRTRVGGVQLQRLDAPALNRLYAELLEDGRRDGRPGGLSIRTVRYVHSIVHRALRDAVREGRLLRNPADAATPPRARDARPPEMRTWSAEQVSQFLEAVRGSRYRAPWLVLATTGMRRGEVLGLRWRDIDLDASRLTIVQTVTLVDHKVRIASRTKTGAGRSIDLDATTIAELRAYRARQAQELFALGRKPEPDTLVFGLPDATPYNPDRFSREFARALDRLLNLEHIRLHDLRHTWATLALAAGVPVKVVSERLGHSGPMVTLSVYAHVSPTMQADAAEKVSALIFGNTTA